MAAGKPRCSRTVSWVKAIANQESRRKRQLRLPKIVLRKKVAQHGVKGSNLDVRRNLDSASWKSEGVNYIHAKDHSPKATGCQIDYPCGMLQIYLFLTPYLSKTNERHTYIKGKCSKWNYKKIIGWANTFYCALIPVCLDYFLIIIIYRI